MSSLDMNHLKSWIGKTRVVKDVITPRLAASLSAVLEDNSSIKEGAPAPCGIQWCLAPDIAPMSQLGADGHPARGDFLPPVPFPRRMWAGGALKITGDFLIGDEVTRQSHIEDVSFKQGRSGALCFVTVQHDYITPRGTAMQERHDIVYRELETATIVRAAPTPPAHYHTAIDGTPTLLFRYSAVTFNGHRIHYDRQYCIQEEHYPGLIVHGPLQATLLLKLASELNGGQRPSVFTFRGVQPLFDGEKFYLNGEKTDDGLTLTVRDAWGNITMQASAV